MTDDLYKTIDGLAKGSFRDRKSKFFGFAYPVNNETGIKDTLKSLKKEYFDASHHCYAWVLGHDRQNFRANDDGEPGGSAGSPILGQIQSRQLTNILVVVVRYYGGVKLGVPGLITAYRSAAAEALNTAQIIERYAMQIFTVSYPYASMNEVMSLIKEENLDVSDQQFEMMCTLKLAVRLSAIEKVKIKFGKIPGFEFEPII